MSTNDTVGRRGGAQQKGGSGRERSSDLSSSTSKKKQKDRANQESREAKRAAAADGIIAEVKKDVFVDWKQNVNEVTVRLRCGEGVHRIEDINTTFTDTHCHVCFPDGRQWSCHLQEEIEASCSRVQYKEKGGFLHLILHKKIPFHIWPSLKPLGAVSSENLKGTSAQPQHQPHPPSSPPNSELRRTSKAELRDKVTADSVDVIGAAGDPGSVTKPAFISRSQQQPQEVGAEHIVIHLPKATRETSEEKDTHCVKANVKSPGAQLLTAQAPQTQQEDDNREERTSKPMVNLQFVKNDSYEKGTDLMVVNVYMKGICRETAKVIFREQDFTLIFQTSDANFLRLHSDCGPNTSFKWQVKLRNLIQPELCSYSFTPSRIDITLKKRHSQRWEGLEAPATQGAVGGAKVAVPSSPACMEKSQPGSSQHKPQGAKEEPPRVGEEKAKTPKASSRVEDGVLESVAPRTVSEHVPKPTCMVQPMTHAPSASNERHEEEEEKKVCLPGFTGLVNLGNTCFMNSVIQTLSNTRELRDYFHDRAFEAEINCSNPLGTGGRLAIGFAVLLKALWKGTHHAFQPSKLKAIVASKASQFTGYAQHDAQEFMAFLLDGLHEDLNRIQNKPYTETVDSDGRLDEVVAEEAWQRHKMRNDSFIVDLFQGQFKSKLVCPTCSKVTSHQGESECILIYSFLVSVSKENSSTAEVLESISRSARVKPENLRLAEVGKNRFQRIFLPSDSLDMVSSSDMLFCFEVLSKELAKERVVLLRVQQKLQVPNIPISKCAACLKPPVSDEDKLKRCTRCYRVGYCNQVCQRTHWPNHKGMCRPNTENVGLPFLVSVPESRLCHARLTQLLEGYSRFSVNVFQPPFQSGRTSPETSQSRLDLVPMPTSSPEFGVSGDGATAPPLPAPLWILTLKRRHLVRRQCGQKVILQPMTAYDFSRRVFHITNSVSFFLAAVTGYQHPSESASGHASQFYISLLDSSNKEQRLDEKEDLLTELPEDTTLALVWKNNERLKEYVLVSSKELEYEEDQGSLSETARAGHFTLEQCLNLFTKPEVLAPEEAWYCPKCQQHREASKQLLLWRLPNVLIIQLKRFSFRSFIWRDKINDMVDFPVRNLDLSKFCIGQKDEMHHPPIYDLYAVINHYGGMIGGHYTAYARLPSDKNSQRSDVGWRLFDDSTVTMVDESQVVTRYAYVLFYRRRNSPVERPPRFLRPVGAETDLDPEGPPTLTPEVPPELFAPSAECTPSSYNNMEEVD
uniref:ubiquitinyl hydrolase 1 n=1 Tax=Cynoglossus semilaevis TaxID=244447 RepID=A0A3P8UPP5_CYNSE